MAVLYYNLVSKIFPETSEAGGVHYRLVYDSDEIYVMNQVGRTIEVVKEPVFLKPVLRIGFFTYPHYPQDRSNS